MKKSRESQDDNNVLHAITSSGELPPLVSPLRRSHGHRKKIKDSIEILHQTVYQHSFHQPISSISQDGSSGSNPTSLASTSTNNETDTETSDLILSYAAHDLKLNESNLENSGTLTPRSATSMGSSNRSTISSTSSQGYNPSNSNFSVQSQSGHHSRSNISSNPSSSSSTSRSSTHSHHHHHHHHHHHSPNQSGQSPTNLSSNLNVNISHRSATSSSAANSFLFPSSSTTNSTHSLPSSSTSSPSSSLASTASSNLARSNREYDVNDAPNEDVIRKWLPSEEEMAYILKESNVPTVEDFRNYYRFISTCLIVDPSLTDTTPPLSRRYDGNTTVVTPMTVESADQRLVRRNQELWTFGSPHRPLRRNRIFSSLQDAMDNAYDGDYIYIKRGDYQNPMTITKPIHLCGQLGISDRIMLLANFRSTITWNVPFDLENNSLDGSPRSLAFKTNPIPKLTHGSLSCLNFTTNDPTTTYSVIVSPSTSLDIHHCLFQNQRQAGLLVKENASVFLTRTSFSGNHLAMSLNPNAYCLSLFKNMYKDPLPPHLLDNLCSQTFNFWNRLQPHVNAFYHLKEKIFNQDNQREQFQRLNDQIESEQTEKDEKTFLSELPSNVPILLQYYAECIRSFSELLYSNDLKEAAIGRLMNGLLKQSIEIFSTFRSFPQSTQTLLHSYSIFARVESLRSYIYSNGGLQAIERVMKSYPKELFIQSESCITAWRLSSTSSIRRQQVESITVDMAVLDALVEFKQVSKRLVVHALSCLWNLSWLSNKIAQRIVQRGMNIILDIQSTNIDDENIQLNAFGLLLNLSTQKEIAFELSNYSILNAAISAINRFPNAIKLHEVCLPLIGSMLRLPGEVWIFHLNDGFSLMNSLLPLASKHPSLFIHIDNIFHLSWNSSCFSFFEYPEGFASFIRCLETFFEKNHCDGTLLDRYRPSRTMIDLHTLSTLLSKSKAFVGHLMVLLSILLGHSYNRPGGYSHDTIIASETDGNKKNLKVLLPSSTEVHTQLASTLFFYDSPDSGNSSTFSPSKSLFIVTLLRLIVSNCISSDAAAEFAGSKVNIGSTTTTRLADLALCDWIVQLSDIVVTNFGNVFPSKNSLQVNAQDVRRWRWSPRRASKDSVALSNLSTMIADWMSYQTWCLILDMYYQLSFFVQSCSEEEVANANPVGLTNQTKKEEPSSMVNVISDGVSEIVIDSSSPPTSSSGAQPVNSKCISSSSSVTSSNVTSSFSSESSLLVFNSFKKFNQFLTVSLVPTHLTSWSSDCLEHFSTNSSSSQPYASSMQSLQSSSSSSPSIVSPSITMSKSSYNVTLSNQNDSQQGSSVVTLFHSADFPKTSPNITKDSSLGNQLISGSDLTIQTNLKFKWNLQPSSHLLLHPDGFKVWNPLTMMESIRSKQHVSDGVFAFEIEVLALDAYEQFKNQLVSVDDNTSKSANNSKNHGHAASTTNTGYSHASHIAFHPSLRIGFCTARCDFSTFKSIGGIGNDPFSWSISPYKRIKWHSSNESEPMDFTSAISVISISGLNQTAPKIVTTLESTTTPSSKSASGSITNQTEVSSTWQQQTSTTTHLTTSNNHSSSSTSSISRPDSLDAQEVSAERVESPIPSPIASPSNLNQLPSNTINNSNSTPTNRIHPITILPVWKMGDVFKCQIDFERQEISIAHNSSPMEVVFWNILSNFDPQLDHGFFPSVSLSRGTSVRLKIL